MERKESGEEEINIPVLYLLIYIIFAYLFSDQLLPKSNSCMFINYISYILNKNKETTYVLDYKL